MVDKVVGKVFCFVNVMEFVRSRNVYRFFVWESSDNGVTWSEPREISEDIRYSEPDGFPFKFHWETTVALDGTSTTTPITVDA